MKSHPCLYIDPNEICFKSDKIDILHVLFCLNIFSSCERDLLRYFSSSKLFHVLRCRISSFRPVLNVMCFHQGNSPAYEFYMPTFRKTLFHIHRQVGMKNVWVRECWGVYMGKGLVRKFWVGMKNVWVRECWGIYTGKCLDRKWQLGMKNVWVRECWGVYRGKGLDRKYRVGMKNVWVRECWGVYRGKVLDRK